MDPIAVVGGGVVGTSIAAALAEQDLPVRLYEKDSLGAGTTSKSMAIFFWHQDDPNGTEHRFRERAWETYGPLIEAGTLEFTQVGTLETAPELTDVPAVRAVWKGMQELGVETEWLEPEALAAKGLDPEAFEGALFVPADGFLDPSEIIQHFTDRATEGPATIETGVEITDIHTEDGRVTAIETSDGTESVSGVVNAAGPWAPQINDLVGVDLPLRHTRGPIVVLSREAEFSLPFMILRNEHYFREDGRNQAFGGRFDTSYETAEQFDPDANHTVDQTFYLDIAGEIEQSVPRLADAEIVNDWVGFRTITPDGRPFVGETAVEGFYTAVGMSGYGVTRAPFVGELLADQIAGEPVDSELADWVAPDRV
ncbi:NAD(P)/FAD-dependent oxidoreductase [Halodesulfurarchaeum formicicum]|uniref:FAD dependent oxidoreductase n=1 Tax=Halodesulfurarchaeum formicicum TaxID=1873524 RepID=A0A1J1ABD8_9EURY|nr:FAD-dependent oxidoreductase [Halodesulfurarchaeum formicicum]APE94889.1 FAD dependent oxidoreductase [Halodesulfurarchaeum formicicum]